MMLQTEATGVDTSNTPEGELEVTGVGRLCLFLSEV